VKNFMEFYQAYKGSSMSLRDDVLNSLVTATFENFSFSGYLFGFGTAIEAETEYGVPFQLSMLVSSSDIGKANTFSPYTAPVISVSADILQAMDRTDQVNGTDYVDQAKSNQVVTAPPAPKPRPEVLTNEVDAPNFPPKPNTVPGKVEQIPLA